MHTAPSANQTNTASHMEQADIDKEQCAQAYGVPLIVVDALSSIAVTSISAKTDGCLDRTAFGS